MDKVAVLKELDKQCQYKEIWLESPKGSSICALINGDVGWLMFLRYEGDAGYSTRNPDEVSDEEIEYVLSNGQEDLYPKKWAYPLTKIKEALLSFAENGEMPKQLKWHNDSK